MRYLVLHNKETYGPFEETEIQELLAVGILTYNDPVAPEGTTKFQPMANTHLIFNREVTPIQHPNEPAIDETAAVLEEQPVTSFSYVEAFIPSPKESRISLKNFIKNLAKLMNRASHPLEKNIFGKALIGFFSKIFAWLTILGVSLLIQQFLFSWVFNVPFKMLFPEAGPAGVSSIGLTIEMCIVFFACVYTLVTMALMTIFGAAGLYDHNDFRLKTLFLKVQPELFKFSFILFEFSLIIITITMGTVLLPERLQFLEEYLVILIFILITNPMLAVPFTAMLEGVGIREAHRMSAILMRLQFKQISYYCLGYILFEAGIDQLAKNFHYIIALKYLLQLFTLIFATYYYKDLSNRTLIRRTKARG